VKNSGGKLGGHGLALAGIIVSAIFLLMLPLLPFMVALMLPALAAGRQTAMQINCMNNEKQLALTVLMYSNDHTNHYPAAATWCDAIKPSAGSEKIFKCPAGNPASRCDYAFNAKLDGLDDSKIDPQTVMIFESDTGWNAHGERELLANRHRANSSVVAFADGHVEMVSSSRVATLRWDP
jgi:prepilin-type processing-associated H-X9-DG protein